MGGVHPRLKLLGRLPGGFLDPAIAATVSPDEDITARALIALHPLCNATDDSSGAIHSAVQGPSLFSGIEGVRMAPGSGGGRSTTRMA